MHLAHSSGRSAVVRSCADSGAQRDFIYADGARKSRPAGIGLIGNADTYTDSCVEWGKKFRNFDRRPPMQRRDRYVYRRSDSASRMFIVA